MRSAGQVVVDLGPVRAQGIQQMTPKEETGLFALVLLLRLQLLAKPFSRADPARKNTLLD
jgi:hypothetical protein